MSLKGGAHLKARLRAIKTAFKPMGKDWAEETARLAKGAVAPYRKSGRLERSIRVKNASQRKATVAAHYSAYFIDAGTKAHEIKPKTAKSLRFEGRGGNIVFTKRVRHPRVGPRPFRQRVAEEALRKRPLLNNLIKSWNHAKGLR